MIPRIIIVLIVCLAVSGWTEARQKTALGSDSLIDIDIDDPRAGDEAVPGSGSGGGKELTTDDEDLASSGSGSGMPPGKPTEDKVTPGLETTTPFKPRTPCEQLRESSRHLIVNYVPRCTETGDYDSLQCQGFPGTGDCWCSDLVGAKIPGTYRGPPHKPDCENGTNLEPCIFLLVQYSRKGQLGQFRPHCTAKGDFHKVQCQGSVCYCVDPTGRKMDGTEVYKPDIPSCDMSAVHTTKTPTSTTEDKIFIDNRPGVVETIVPVKNQNAGATRRPSTTTTTKQPSTAAPEVDLTMKPPSKPEGEEEEEKDKEEGRGENETGQREGTGMETKRPVPDHRDSPAAQIMTQPGLLAAIIGGAVVGLLCAVLLVMFLVYRMRKKDEGSYALDEPRRMPNYPYTRAPDKEFYA